MNDIAVIESQISEAEQKAQAIVISNQQSYEEAVGLTLAYKKLEKTVIEFFAPMKAKAKATHQEICDTEKKYLAPVKAVQAIVDTKAVAWQVQEKLRLEKERLDREALAKKQQEEIRLAEAERLEKSGHQQEAVAILNQPIVCSVPTEEPVAVKGFSVVAIWSFEIVDPNLLPRQYLIPDTKAIGQTVRALKDRANIPGIRVFAVDSVRKRT